MQEERRSRFPWALLAGAGIMLALLAGAYLLTRQSFSEASRAPQRLPFGPAEQAYAEHIHFLNLEMSRAANFLNQEVTFLSGAVSNDGYRMIVDMEATVEFRDSFNQVILRETHRPLGPRANALLAGRRRDFQLAFEHVPADWNRQYPSIRVTGLVLE